MARKAQTALSSKNEGDQALKLRLQEIWLKWSSSKGSLYAAQRPLDIVLCRLQDLECGVHSGIPICCVMFYVFERFKLDPNDNYFIESEEVKERVVDHIQYVPCPACLAAERFAVIKKCDCFPRL